MGSRLLFVVLSILLFTACARNRVVTQPDLPALAPPPPPPRVVAPPDTEEQETPPNPEPEHRPARRVPPKGETTREPVPKVEPPKTPPKPETPPPPVPEVAPPGTTLQTAQPATQAEMEKQTKTLLVQASRDLGRVNYGALNADGKGQYDTAKRFVEQAHQALKEQNPVLALRLADKAATIAAVLVAR